MENSMMVDTLKHKLERYKSFIEWFCYDAGYKLQDIQEMTNLIENSLHPTFDIGKHIKQLHENERLREEKYKKQLVKS
jgi:hypothetical protein